MTRTENDSTPVAAPEGARRVRAGLRRHGLVPRPAPIPALLGGQVLRLREGNEVTVYESGHKGLAAMLAAIRAARRRVHLETYILRTDATGRRFLQALEERARAGAAVRLLYDAVGSLGLDPRALAPLVSAGADVVVFNPLRRLLPRWLRRRDHRKVLVVDGEVAFTGGLNVGDEYWGDGEARVWRDTQVRLRGPVVLDLEAVFLESWFRADGPDVAWHELLESPPAPAGRVRCGVLPDGPVYRRRRTRDLVVAGLEAARRRVRFASPYFAPGPLLLDALAGAARRGVAVELLVAGPQSDHPWLWRGAHALFPALLEAGVRILEYQGAMMHAKVGIFDGRWAVVGSSNLDRQSLRHSYEVNVVVEGEEIAGALEAGFERDVAHAREVDAKSLAGRSLGERILDGLAGWTVRLV